MTGFDGLAKLLLITGGSILLLGILIALLGNIHFPLGKLPGDIVIKKENFTFYFPIVTTLLLSLVLTLLLNLVLRLIGK